MSPVKPENRVMYPPDWPSISRRIRARDGNRCKWCNAPNGQTIVRRGRYYRDEPLTQELGFEVWRTAHGIPKVNPLDLPGADAEHRVRIVLTVAHLNHNPVDCRDENLAALCQRCHLEYDRLSRRARLCSAKSVMG